jgi:hypothetical protein
MGSSNTKQEKGVYKAPNAFKSFKFTNKDTEFLKDEMINKIAQYYEKYCGEIPRGNGPDYEERIIQIYFPSGFSMFTTALSFWETYTAVYVDNCSQTQKFFYNNKEVSREFAEQVDEKGHRKFHKIGCRDNYGHQLYRDHEDCIKYPYSVLQMKPLCGLAFTHTQYETFTYPNEIIQDYIDIYNAMRYEHVNYQRSTNEGVPNVPGGITC